MISCDLCPATLSATLFGLSVVGVVSHHGGPSSGWSLSRMVLRQDCTCVTLCPFVLPWLGSCVCNTVLLAWITCVTLCPLTFVHPWLGSCVCVTLCPFGWVHVSNTVSFCSPLAGFMYVCVCNFVSFWLGSCVQHCPFVHPWLGLCVCVTLCPFD